MDSSDSALKSDDNEEEGVGNDGDTNAAAEITGLNEVTETEAENEAVVAGGGVENSVAAAEEVVAGVVEEPEMVDGEGKIGVGEGLKEEATDVAEGMEKTEMAGDIGEVKEENENEAEVEEKKVEAVEEFKVAEVEGAVPMERTEIAEETEAAVEVVNETGEMNEMKTEDKMEEEEIGVTIAADEMQVIEEAEAMEEGNNAEDIEGHEVKGDNAEEVVEGHEMEGGNAEEIEEGHKMEGDNAEDIVEGLGIEGDIAEIEEGHKIERDNAEDIVEGHEIGDNAREIGGGHEIDVDTAEDIEEGHEISEYNAETEVGHTKDIEGGNGEDIEGGNGEDIEGDNAEEIEGDNEEGIEGDNAEEIEGRDIDGDNAEETECGHEIEGDNADKIEEGDNAEEVELDNAEEMEEGDNAEEVELDNAEDMEEGDNEENVEMADGTEEATTEEVEEVGSTLAGKRKRGKNAKAPVRTPSRNKAEEDVCFICFDGGELVLCDRRGCPKAYHPTCVNRDDAFFQTKGRWNCGWHICSSCEKNAYYMCLTCTFSLCKGCVKDSVILCVRGNKGFCETCMKTIMLIESNEQGNKETAQVDFDDRSSFEYLFKDYWVDLKGKLSLTLDELSQAKSPWKGSESSVGKRESRDELYDFKNDGGSGSDDSSGKPEVNSSKRKRAKKRLKSHSKERDSKISKKLNGAQEALTDDVTGWASKELLEFVMHMKNGDRSVCSQFDVQALLLEYIKRNKLRDPRRKSQIICDSRLEKLFGKSRVGHFEMLKLLESHFLLKEDSHADDLQGGVFDTEANQSEVDGSGKDRRRKSRKKNDGRGLQSNLDDYAAIDTNNINLIYLRRSLVENLLDATETFHDKVVGAFVRIRISGSAQKQDLYRLVQVVGTSKAAEPYKVGKKTTEFLLEILNLNKTEIVSIDIISNQDFTEDECKRLRQSIKCGLIDRLTVGDIQEKALALQAVRVEDALETEITRISHLRDRASDMGKRKELRECVEKLQRLKSPDERRRRLEEIPEVHTDPNMDPSYESEEDEDDMDDRKQENYLGSGGSSFNRRGRDPVSPARGSFSGTNRDLTRNLSNKSFLMKGDDVPVGGDMLNENLWSADREMQLSQTRERPKPPSNLESRSVSLSLPQEPVPSVKPEIPVVPLTPQINETEKIWHYKDPSGKIQGPFSMVQLRKWNNTGYFPADLRIWRVTESQDDSILLTDALAGNFQREPRKVESHPKTPLVPSQFEISNSTPRTTPTPVEISRHSTDKWDSETNLPSPTPGQGGRSGTKGQPRESRWSPTPVGPTSLGVSNGETRTGSLAMAQSGQQLLHSPIPSGSQKMVNSGNLLGLFSQSTLPVESPRVQGGSHLVLTPDSGVASVNVANLQNPVQGPPQVAANSNQPSAYGGWATTTVQPAAPNAPWGMGVTDQQATTPRPGPENQTTGWGPIPGNTNMGWRGPVPTTPNQGWVAPSHPGPGPAHGNANPGWTGHANTGWAGSAQGQLQVSPYPGWVPPFQGPGPVSNQGWVAPGQGPTQGTGNPNQPPAKPNMGLWTNEKGGERFSSRRDSGDSGYGGGKPWNRQQQQNRGDSSRPPFKGQRVCKYHESGHCRKGASCDYLHT